MGGIYLVWRWAASPRFDWQQFRQVFAHADPVYLGLACAISLAAYTIRSVRWQAMLKPMAPESRLWPVLKATVIGFTAVVVAGRAGELVRPLLIARSQAVSFSSQVALWFLERLTDLIAVLLFFGVALSRMAAPAVAKAGPELQWVATSGGRLIAILSLVSFAILFLLRGFSPASAAHLAGKLRRISTKLAAKLEGLLDSFAQGMEAARDLRVLTEVLLYTLLEWLLVACCFHAVLQSFPASAHLTFWDTLALTGFSTFGAIVQIPGIGGGMQVVAFLVLSQIYEVAAEPATAIAATIWLVSFGVVVPPGLFLAAKSGLSWNTLRRPAPPPGV